MKDIAEAFRFPFRDPDWISKFLVGALMVLFSLLLVGLFFLLGYYIRTTQRVMRKEANPLPDWSDLGGLFVLGLKYALVYLVYLVPIIVVVFLFIVVAVVTAATQSQESFLPLIIFFYAVIFFLLVPYGLALTVLSPVITIHFALKEEMRDGLALSTIVRFFTKNWAQALIVAVLIYGLESIEGIGILFFIVGIFFTIFYVSLVGHHLMGQLYLASLGAKEAA